MKKVSLAVAFLVTVLTASAQIIPCSTPQFVSKDANLKMHFFDTSKKRGVADNYYLWNNGQVLTVKFLGGSKPLQNRIRNWAMEWEKHANIKFRFVEYGEADIRILPATGRGHNSFIGLYNNLVPQDMQTMNLDTTDLLYSEASFRSTVLHEFGHALGLLHEHSSPISGIKWNKEAVYANYARIGWDRAKVDAQVFQTYANSYTNGTQYDNKSIMHYSIESWETLDGYTVKENLEFSEGDKVLIGALYPKTGNRRNEVPRYQVYAFKGVKPFVNTAKNGISFHPEFSVKALGSTGDLYYCILIGDENGIGLADKDGNYAYGSTVAAVSKVTLFSSITASYNVGKKDAEMFIPYSQLHLPAGTHTLTLAFRVVQITPEGEIKLVFFGDPEEVKVTL